MARRRGGGIDCIGITTGGGDAPGLNAVIRAVLIAAHGQGWKCMGIRDGYTGLLEPGGRNADLVHLTPEKVRGITHLGGTILGTTNAANPLRYPTRLGGGRVVERDRSRELLAAMRSQHLDALVAIGGDGSMGIASALARQGLRVVGVPKTSSATCCAEALPPRSIGCCRCASGRRPCGPSRRGSRE
jgi:6-phosphofructokinase 1